jgi:glycosyltransferase involved in cell wall biosynthesis
MVTLKLVEDIVRQKSEDVVDRLFLVGKPKVSVCMITFQHAEFLRQSLESVLAQKTDFDFEVVLADDCSTDGTDRIALEFQQKFPQRMRVLLARENLGRHTKGGHINLLRALQACRGEYVAILEGDDYWMDPEKLAIQVGYMDQHPDCAVTTHNMNILSPDGSQEISRPHVTQTVYNLEETLEHFIVPTASIMIRRTLLPLPFSAWAYELPGLAGYLVYHAMMVSGGHMKFFPRVMGVYRMHPGGVHSHLTNLRQNQNGLRGRDLLRRNMFPKSRALARLIRRFATNVFMNHMMNRSYDEARAVAQRYLWQSACYCPKDLYLCLSAYLPFLFDLALRSKLERLKPPSVVHSSGPK